MAAHLVCYFFKGEALFEFKGWFGIVRLLQRCLRVDIGMFVLSFGVAVWALVLVFYVVYDLSVLAVWDFFY